MKEKDSEKIKDKNLTQNENNKKPLEDKRFTNFLSSMSLCYNTDIKSKEHQLPKSSLRKIISKNEYLKDYQYEKFDGIGPNEIEIKRKVFEKLASMSELMI